MPTVSWKMIVPDTERMIEWLGNEATSQREAVIRGHEVKVETVR